jgi:hypothetical protein
MKKSLTDLSKLTPQEKLALINNLRTQVLPEDDSETMTIIKHEKRSLLSLLSIGELPPITSATLAYLPISDQSKSLPIKEIFDHLPTLFNIYQFSYGSIGLIVLPIDENDLFQSKQLVNSMLKKALTLCSFIGASHISLAGLLPSITQYGEEIKNHTPKTSSLSITTGHATTTATVVITLENILQNKNRIIQNETLGFLGLGSIGQSSLELILSSLPHPKEIILCDIALLENKINQIKTTIIANGFKGKVTCLFSDQHAPTQFYKSSIIIGATNQANILDVSKLNPQTIVIDDSIPHCFDANKAFERMTNQKDIICIEAGIIEASHTIQEVRYSPKELIPYQKYLPKIITHRKESEITSCILSSLLTATYTELPPSTGIPNINLAKKHLKILKELNFNAPKLRLNGTDIPI